MKLDIGKLYCIGIPDKLSRVWINIVTNAVQAMDGKGRIKIKTKAVRDSAVITISNDGPPVPEEIRRNIFEPFFTTKKSTGGMGLGLDICRRLVSSFNGRLYYNYEKSWNVFTVELPLAVE